MKKFLLPLFIFTTSIFITTIASAQIKLPSIIADHMVLQQKTDATLWGWAEPNEVLEIKGSWNNSMIKATADGSGKWQANIKTTGAGGPYLLTFKGKNTITISDVYLGEVWLCSGQSNMDRRVAAMQSPDSVGRSATNPLIRMFTVQKQASDVPQEELKGSWAVNSPETVGTFSAVAYHFGNELANKLSIPIGLIHSSWGGTPAESWVNKKVFQTDESFKPIWNRYEGRIRKYEVDKQNPANQKLVDPRTHQQAPSVLFNAMIKPLVNYRIKGVIWYQGETNAPRAYQYRKLFPALIANWREEFKMAELPFYYVQIAPFKGQNPEIREAQLMTLKSVDFVGMAVTTDVGNCEDIHPTNKIPVGKRLAYIALNKNYNKKGVEWQSPIYNHFEVDGAQIKVFFETTSNLVAKGSELKGFKIAGNDQQFYPATAKIQGKTITVYSTEVKNPVAVRFGWDNCPDVNLFNRAGLPASPFRTDSWKGETEGKN
ncbi:MAG: sialate O-acetylesterase [Pedobacter sp.]|nr:sialate O-acetylesterase [Pedobacter sp.]